MSWRTRAVLFWSPLFAAAFLPACESRDRSAPQPGSGAAQPDTTRREAAVASADGAPTLQELKNATYRGFEATQEPVTLSTGRWEGEPHVASGASRPMIHFVRDFHLVGDVDGDGEDEAVVLLGESSGGSGESIYLAVVRRQAGQLQNVATQRLGDRLQLRDARIERRRILLDLVQSGPNDAMCCPGELVTRAWELLPEGLQESAVSTPPGRLSLATIGGTEWVLRSWTWDEPAPVEPEVTLRFQENRLAGRSGCNRYFASVTPGDAPGDVSLGPAGSTRMACPGAAEAVETRFLAQLAGVKKFGFMATQLALSYEKDGVRGVMLFEGREPSEAN